jgi:hypothetical protein
MSGLRSWCDASLVNCSSLRTDVEKRSNAALSARASIAISLSSAGTGRRWSKAPSLMCAAVRAISASGFSMRREISQASSSTRGSRPAPMPSRIRNSSNSSSASWPTSAIS